MPGSHPYLTYATARLACMLCFMAPGLAYGLVTSRMPALKTLTGATEGEIGLILLVFGLAGLVGLSCAPKLVERLTAKTTLVAAAVGCMLFVVLVAFSTSVVFFGVSMALLGLCVGVCDVTMNIQGVYVERTYSRNTMTILHGGYNIGAAAAAASGSVFAVTSLPLWVNYTLPAALMAFLIWWAEPRLLTAQDAEKSDAGNDKETKAAAKVGRLPLLVWICGLLCVCCYVVEGTVGEWGSLYLHQVKSAPESVAALVFAGFSVCSLFCRLTADRLRNAFGDVFLSTAGALLALAGMLTVLTASGWTACLAGYALIGLGLAPIVPIAFSRAGAVKDVNLAKATALVSLLAYAGLLFAPPAFGLAAEHFGLHASLSAVPVLLTVLFVLGLIMGRLLKKSL